MAQGGITSESSCSSLLAASTSMTGADGGPPAAAPAPVPSAPVSLTAVYEARGTMATHAGLRRLAVRTVTRATACAQPLDAHALSDTPATDTSTVKEACSRGGGTQDSGESMYRIPLSETNGHPDK
jgi:hypothetical protein